MLIHLLARNPNVESITIVEQCPDVIGLTQRLTLPSQIINDDFYYCIDRDESEWGPILVDLWASNNGHESYRLYLEEAIPLAMRLSQQYPAAIKDFHGFPDLCDFEIVPDGVGCYIQKYDVYGRR